MTVTLVEGAAPREEQRRRPKQARAKQSVNRILEVTAQLLAEEGLERTNVNRIARAVGISAGSIYQYFPDKQALVGALVEDRFLLLYSRNIDWVAGAMDRPIAEVAETLLRRTVAFYQENLQLMQVLHQQVNQIPANSQVSHVRQQVFGLTRILLISSREPLSFADVDVAATMLIQTIRTFAPQIAGAAPYPVSQERMIRETVVMMCRYVGAAEPTWEDD